MSCAVSLDELATWLKGKNDAYDLKPLRLKIGKTEYEGCFYREIRTFRPEGKIEEVDYVFTAIYVLGDLPKSYQRSRRECYQLSGGATLSEANEEWYIGSIGHGTTEFSPLGPRFLLMPWTTGKIDQFEETKYRRVQVKVQEI